MGHLVVHVASVSLAALLVTSIIGLAPTRLLLPHRLRPYEVLLFPPVGVAVAVVTSSLIDTFLLPLDRFAWILVSLSAAADIAVVMALRGKGRPPVDLTTVFVASSLAVASLILGVAPLFHYGYVTTIGANWDPEIYLPLADLIARFRIDGAIPVDANPLSHMLNEPTVRAGWGFSYLHAFIDVLTAQPPHATFVVLVALLTALQITGSWILFRSLGISPGRTLLGTVFLMLNDLVLWTDYFGFANESLAFALLPCAIAIFLAAFDDGRWTSATLASLVIAALLLTYYVPTVTILLPLLALAVIRRLVMGQPFTTSVWTIGVGTLGSLIFSVVGQVRFFQVLPYLRSSAPPPGPGITQFIPVGAALGTVSLLRGTNPHSYTGQIIELAGNLFTVLSLLLIAYSTYRWRKTDIAPIALGCTLVAVLFLIVTPYPYGYFKALSLVAFVFTTLMAIGLVDAAQFLRSLQPDASKFAVLLGGGLLVIEAINGLGVTYHYLGAGPGLYSEPLVQLTEARTLIPRNASVYIGDAGKLQGPIMGFISYALIDQRIYGNLRTGYSTYSRRCDCALPDYALYPRDTPLDPPYTSYQEVWHNEGFRLLKRPDGLAYSFFDAKGSLLRNGDSYAMLVDPAPGTAEQASPTPSPVRHDYDIVVHVLSPTPSTLRASVGSAVREVKVDPGVSAGVILSSVELPGILTLQIEDGGPVYLQTIDAWVPGHNVPVRTIDRDILFARWSSALVGSEVHTKLAYAALGTGDSLQPVIDIYGSAGQHYGWWSLNPAQTDGIQPIEFQLNLQSKRGGTTVAGRPNGGSQVTPVVDGRYEASLFLWRNGQVWRAIPLFAFALVNGQVADFRPLDGDFIVQVPGP